MGRGRAKAKQTKVARDLKYNAQDMDLDRLAKELHGEIDTTSRKDDDDRFTAKANLDFWWLNYFLRRNA